MSWHPLSKLPRHTNGRTFGHYVGFNVQQVPYTADLQWNRISNLDPPTPKPRPYHWETSVPKREKAINHVFSTTFILSSRLGVNDWHLIFVKLSLHSQD
ncbi:hypothetical protein AVEN_164377-1 [Araneus ventricosus]|uniref:Uncharacterized protein n=1 Tax=Araneus ventricosus TaxID=182803 RepID=A0A4Y2GEU4_ARAVE|nr:hypothetical protein AVEN_164377-1 [Araneus ventricosus]